MLLSSKSSRIYVSDAQLLHDCLVASETIYIANIGLARSSYIKTDENNMKNQMRANKMVKVCLIKTTC